MHDGNSLECGNYVSDVFDSNTRIWWHCDNDDITEISDFPEGVYTRESNKKTKNKKLMSRSNKTLLVVYVITSNLISPSSVFDK